MKKIKLIILQGAPASGKSTYARRLAKNNPTTHMIVSRDSLRTGMGEYWVPNREKIITHVEYEAIYNGLKRGFSVIVDATNLNPYTQKNLKNIAAEVNEASNDVHVEVEFKHFEIPLWKAIWRDWKRGLLGGRSVGKKVVKDFYKRYKL